MIAFFITFFGAVVLLFIGLNKRESSFSIFAAGILFLSAFLCVASKFGWCNFGILESWVPTNMMQFSSEQLLFMGLLSFLTGFIILSFRDSDIIGNDQLALMMFSLCGAYMMVSYQHIVVLFLGIEVLSIPLYVLAGSKKDNIYSNEAALKYFLMGAFSTGIFLLGSAFIYGGTGSLELELMGIKPSFMHAIEGMPIPVLINAGIILMGVGLLFKVAAVPFHFWAPDVYQGSPNRTTVFMATVVKISAFIALYRLLNTFVGIKSNWSGWLSILATITILWGNLAAMIQQNVKRTLAYSSIAHAGYLLIFILIADGTNAWILWFYGLAYGIASILVFTISHQLYNTNKDDTFEAFNGLAKSSPIVAIGLVIGVLSLAGIPISAGFVGKFYLFSFAWQSDPMLVCTGLVGSALGVAYYFKFIKHAFLKVGEKSPVIKDRGILIFLVLIILMAGVFPWILLRTFF